jgi:hypothetical protein
MPSPIGVRRELVGDLSTSRGADLEVVDRLEEARDVLDLMLQGRVELTPINIDMVSVAVSRAAALRQFSSTAG